MRKSRIQIRGSTAELHHKDSVKFLSGLKSGSVDLIISSPPYFVGKEYDKSARVADFKTELERVMPSAVECLRPGGSLCWQVGSHVEKNCIVPLDALVYAEACKFSELNLRNRIVWVFGHGVHAPRRFSGRHETILWFTKGEEYAFNVDAVRVPQKYPGKRHYKGPNKGEWSGNPRGKNPTDVWEIPNVKANHVEKTCHPCQFPIALVRRLVRALSSEGGLVVDPYLGSGTSAVAALDEGRNFSGSDIEERYVRLAIERLKSLKKGQLSVRGDVPVHTPSGNEAVATVPPHFIFQ